MKTRKRRCLFLWPEVKRSIGLGHLYETLAVAQAAAGEGYHCTFLLAPYEPAKEVLAKTGFPYVEIRGGVREILRRREIRKAAYGNPFVLNHRAVKLSNQRLLGRAGFRVVVIDQLGGLRIEADVLVNSSPVRAWHRYSFGRVPPRTLFGLRYALLRSEFRKISGSSGRAVKVVVMMGGVDRTGATVRIARALKNLPIEGEIVLILGPGFRHNEELRKVLSEAGRRRRFVPLRAVSNVADVLRGAAFLICAGGNSLFEAAALGIPSLVLWEDGHERIQGRACENLGFALCLGSGRKTPLCRIRSEVLRLLESKEERLRMAKRARKCVDGLGTLRLLEVLEEREGNRPIY
ncbi:MAG: hypothetical protein D6679_10205 [Candidatus Hydrogenedentota bacterium]|nr:MAG: hypothetical protein D6679_10205 [Candidatus Hydrogenedentota bacterium]